MLIALLHTLNLLNNYFYIKFLGLINPMMNPMMPGTMAPMGMGHPSMMMMNRMPSPFGPPRELLYNRSIYKVS
jgi:hypothetical protein